MSRFGWGVNGYGRACLYAQPNDRMCIFEMLPGSSGRLGQIMLEEQDKIEKTKFVTNPNYEGPRVSRDKL